MKQATLHLQPGRGRRVMPQWIACSIATQQTKEWQERRNDASREVGGLVAWSAGHTKAQHPSVVRGRGLRPLSWLWHVVHWIVLHWPERPAVLALFPVVASAAWGLSYIGPVAREGAGLVLMGAALLGLIRWADVVLGPEREGRVTSRDTR